MILTPASGVIPGTIRWLWEEHIQCQSLNTAGTAQDEWAAALGGADDLLWWSSDLVDSLLPAQVVNAGTLSQCHNRATVFLPGVKEQQHQQQQQRQVPHIHWSFLSLALWPARSDIAEKK